MRAFRVGVAGVAIVVVCVGLLVGGCEFREGDKREYGGLGNTAVWPGLKTDSETIVGSN